MEPDMYPKLLAMQQEHWWYCSRRNFFDIILKKAPRGGKVLDIGCGPGSMLNYLKKYGTVTGYDLSADALELARTHFDGELVQGDANKLPFPDNTFSLVCCCEVLSHKWITDVGTTVKEYARVLAPGGKLIVTDSAFPSLTSSHDKAVHLARRFLLRDMVQYFSEAGLQISHASYAYGALLPVAWLYRKLKGILGLNDSPKSELFLPPKLINSLIIKWFWLEAQISSRWFLPGGLAVQVYGSK